MSKKNSGANLGRSLLRKRHNNLTASTRHTTLDDKDGGHQPISITENTSIDEFLSNAEAAQRSFEAERGSAAIADLGVVNEVDADNSSDDDEIPFCTIPMKPDWREIENPEEYHRLETETFLRWKRQLNKLQNKNPNLPPFEKNLEFWRQLWKIIELSHVVVQVVDARDPLFYFSHDLSEYVTTISGGAKANVILLNKADFLSFDQRSCWAEYFQESDMKTLYFTATEVLKDEIDLNETRSLETKDKSKQIAFNTPYIMTPHNVLSAIKTLEVSLLEPVLVIGFVGYPNVGKSSVINNFLENKRLQVSATPGKTKHYQTHVVDGGGKYCSKLG